MEADELLGIEKAVAELWGRYAVRPLQLNMTLENLREMQRKAHGRGRQDVVEFMDQVRSLPGDTWVWITDKGIGIMKV